MLVTVLSGSNADFATVKEICEIFKRFGVEFDAHILSAHRSPVDLLEYVKHCEVKGCRVYVCAAGKAAHLAGVVASHTLKPVIGVPLSTSLMGLDSLLSTSQMPKGVPVATVGVDAGENAALLALQILALDNKEILVKLQEYRTDLANLVREQDANLSKWLPKIV
jgi:5-(carboxyamino)imidazole ribonucleotide mutase